MNRATERRGSVGRSKILAHRANARIKATVGWRKTTNKTSGSRREEMTKKQKVCWTMKTCENLRSGGMV
jgi:hypothetical protein